MAKVFNLEHQISLKLLKDMVRTYIFCPVTHKTLDWENAIMITVKKPTGDQTRVFDASVKKDVQKIRDHFGKQGIDVEIFENIKK